MQDGEVHPFDHGHGDDLAELVTLLRRVSATLDQLWNEAVTARTELAVRFGEASLGVHRALIALHDDAAWPTPIH